MNIAEALSQFKTRFNQIIEIQTLLMNVDKMNFEETKILLFKLNVIIDKHVFCHFLESIDSAIYARPNNYLFYIDIILDYKEWIEKYLSQYELYRIFGNHIVVYNLYRHSLFTLDFINSIKYNSESIENIFNLLIKNTIGSSDKSELESKCYDGKNPNPIAQAIKNDDISTLQMLLSKENISINSSIPYSVFEISYFLTNEPSLIEYAAFSGSVQCFKFLLLQTEIMIPETITRFAIAGGNYDIIHLIESQDIPFTSDDLNCAVEFFRNDVAEYLIESSNCLDTNHESVFTSIAFYNVDYFVNHISEVTNINTLNKYKSTLLQTAAYYGQLDFVEFLLSIDDIDVKMKSSMNKTAKEISEEVGEIEIAALLASVEKS